MTAEIAIMNKMAIALAADSAVTISAGRKEEKIFDSADKLFELSNNNAIGIMMYAGTSFMQVPLPTLIRQFRSECPQVKKVEQVAERFLKFLDDFGRTAPETVKHAVIWSIIRPIAERMKERLTKKFQERILGQGGPPADPRAVLDQIIQKEIELVERVYSSLPDGEFVGDGPLEIRPDARDVIEQVVLAELPMIADNLRPRLVDVGVLILQKGSLSPALTGIVIAGFGSGDLFPTLVSFELDGMVCDRLKYMKTNYVDIDRSGRRAAVIPFAQKEMVERFLYGLDEDIQREISTVCKRIVPTIRTEISKLLEFENDKDRTDWSESVKGLEDAFIKGLDEEAFQKIRDQSRAEIEDMVEFMPKPELAKMAEALVNLTSIKRRVSRGMETVGGPIDVAVISQSEGFVWVKRKHYFPADLNLRYHARVQRTWQHHQESNDGPVSQPRRPARARGGKAKSGKKTAAIQGIAEGGGDNEAGNAQSSFREPNGKTEI